MRLVTPNPDRVDEMDCLIDMGVKVALRDYQPAGALVVDGQACARR